jgi:hypothetical protein
LRDNRYSHSGIRRAHPDSRDTAAPIAKASAIPKQKKALTLGAFSFVLLSTYAPLIFLVKC